MSHPIRVLVVDDSAVMRRALSESLSRERGIEVVATAGDPYVARERILRLNPDVLTLDIEMPAMDGLTFLEKLMRRRPMPVVMVSSFTDHGSELTLRALELGAVNFVSKPVRGDLGELTAEIADKIREAAHARIRVPLAVPPGAAAPQVPIAPTVADRIIVVGASAGGVDAIREFLSAMPPDCPGIAIVQHMPERFTRAFAARCDAQCPIGVSEATDGARLLRGHAIIARGDHHLRLVRGGQGYRVRLDKSPAVSGHRPSVDVLFQSAAEAAGARAVGVILTGMGADGARGMLAMHRRGARTIAQDEASCVVFGMPKEAIALGAVESVLPLARIPAAALELSGYRPRSRRLRA